MAANDVVELCDGRVARVGHRALVSQILWAGVHDNRRAEPDCD
ncbi:hypothetical protein SAMN05519103_09172 [Rhizobiales bacterium GAS113]|nr:hypothetical protein SAMN05519103_09172 [Rhizobiales bacterium GAS113]